MGICLIVKLWKQTVSFNLVRMFNFNNNELWKK